MNLVFAAKDAATLQRAQTWVRSRYGEELDVVAVPDPSWHVGVMAPTSVVSIAQRDDMTVVAIGAHLHDVGAATRSLADVIADRLAADGSAATMPEGQWAAAVFGPERVEVMSDSAGMRTWFWSDDPTPAFSSNLRLLAESAEVTEVDRRYEDFFLIHGFYPKTATPYVGIEAQPAGSAIAFAGDAVDHRFLDFRTPESFATPESEGEAIDLLHDEFLAALRQQATGVTKAGVLLGGFDSALVAAGLSRIGVDVETFSFAYEDATFNQPLVEELAVSLGIKHHWIPVGPDQIRDGMQRFTDVFNRATNWPNYVISTAAACEAMVEAGVDGAFSGDGCDSVFLGYPGTYRRERVVKAMSHVPAFLSRLAVRILARPIMERRLGHPYRVMLGLLRGQSRSPSARTFLSFRLLDPVSLHQLRRDGSPKGVFNVDAVAEDLAEPHAHLPRYRLAYAGKGAVSPNKNKMIGSSDLTGLTIWSPYLQDSVKGIAGSLPEEMMRPDEKTASSVTGKYILQRMAVEKGLLPYEIVYQKKVAAVDAPIDDWYAGELLPTLEGMWRNLPFAADCSYLMSLVRPKFAERLFRDRIMVDKVISHAASLLATYGAFAEGGHGRR